MKKVTQKQAEKVLDQVAAWMGPRMGYEGPAPKGSDAAYKGDGPELKMDWDWPSSGPTPTVLLESSLAPDDWAMEVSSSVNVPGVWVEPYASYALCIYRDE